MKKVLLVSLFIVTSSFAMMQQKPEERRPSSQQIKAKFAIKKNSSAKVGFTYTKSPPRADMQKMLRGLDKLSTISESDAE